MKNTDTTARPGRAGTRRLRRSAPRRLPVCTGAKPTLREYDVVVLNHSAGKDSSAAADAVMEQARAEGVTERVVMVYADLGDMAWPGTKDLAAEHAAQYGVRFEVVARRNKLTGAVETILERVLERGRFPDAARRWCTSDSKRGPVLKLITRLVTELRASGRVVDRPVRVLNVFGFRAEESAARAGRVTYAPDQRASNGRRDVDTWLPIHGWSLAQVWTRIRVAGLRVHPAYAAGMTRLSCVLCVLGSRADLVTAARLQPDLAARFAHAERVTGHDFRQGLPMRTIIALAAAEDGAQPTAEASGTVDQAPPGACPAMLDLFGGEHQDHLVSAAPRSRRGPSRRRHGTTSPLPTGPDLFAEPHRVNAGATSTAGR